MFLIDMFNKKTTMPAPEGALPGRDHVNALTSGAFRRGALAFAAEVEAAEAETAE